MISTFLMPYVLPDQPFSELDPIATIPNLFRLLLHFFVVAAVADAV